MVKIAKLVYVHQSIMDKRLIKFLLKRPASWMACCQILVAMICKRSHVITRRNGIVIQTKIGNGEGLFCAVAGIDYEPEMRWFLDQMKPDQCFIDVGANVGIYSLHASRRLGNRGKVHAFEPTPETFDTLNQNIRLNSFINIESHKLALSDHCGILHLVAGDRPASNATSVEGSGLSIQALTLDEFRETHPDRKIDFIKVDIEGGEEAFFRGGKDALRRDNPVILFESMHTGPSYPERQFLRDLGYRLYFLEINQLSEIPEDSIQGGNVIAMR